MNITATTARCLRCSRVLRSAKSIAAGVGPTCKGKIAAAARTAPAKPAQVAKAIELVELGAVIPLATRRSGTRVFRVVSSRGDASYLTAAHNCSCPAGLRGRSECYHELAVQLITAA